MRLGRMMWGVALVLTVLTVMGGTIGMTIGKASAGDGNDLQGQLAQLRADHAALRDAFEKAKADVAEAQTGWTRDVLQLQQQLADASERANRAVVRLTRAENKLAVIEEQAATRERWLLALFLRVGSPGVPVLVQQLQANAKEAGRWVFPLLRDMGAEARAAIPVLRAIIANPKMQAEGVAAVAQETLDAILE